MTSGFMLFFTALLVIVINLNYFCLLFTVLTYLFNNELNLIKYTEMHHHRMSDGERGEPWGASVAQNPSRVTDRPSRRLPFTPTIPEVQPVQGQGEGQPHNGDDKLFIQLLDDLDNISGGSQASVHRRRRAREIFSEWLFSQDVHNPQVMRLKSEQSGRRLSGGDFGEFDLKKQGRQHSCDAEPFSREQSSRRSCGVLSDLSVHRRGLLRRTRPSSFHYPSEVSV